MFSHPWKRLSVAIVLAIVISACGSGGSDDELASTSTTATVDATTTTEVEATSTAKKTTTTTAATTTLVETTTEAPETTVAPVADDAATDDAKVTEYCTALDDIDAFFDGDFPDEADIQAAVDDQQSRIAAIVPPNETIGSAHESYAGALLKFYDALETNDYDLSDDQVDDLFDGIDVILAERIVERYREVNCPGFEAPEESTEDDDTERVSADFSFEVGKCINQSGSDFDEVECDVPHDFQVYFTVEVEDADEYPGEGPLADQAEVECIEAFEQFVGTSFQESIYFATTLRPSALSWTLGDRELVCLAQAESGQLTKDLRGVNE